ncbi:MAG: CDP-alcohol phosphatidyltransferase family protein, partial [Thermoplasmata archaeon]|nr:CDP-alcohol phosphatidyltransferase family protein [Thermoplasmata archaeon]
MRRGGRWPANLATLANGLVGIGAIAYTLAGNSLWAMLLIVAGVGFDGLDGFLARRARLPSTTFGRVADSISDTITFALAPAVLIAVHTDHASLWSPWAFAAGAVAVLVGGLAIARLVYFTLRGYRRKDFLGVPTPQNALALVVVLLFLDVPAFVGIAPGPALALAAVLGLLMVVPVPFPKIRRGSRLRGPMTLTALALILAILPIQFRPGHDTALYGLAEAAAVLAAVGLALYYLVGPFTVPSQLEEAATE